MLWAVSRMLWGRFRGAQGCFRTTFRRLPGHGPPPHHFPPPPPPSSLPPAAGREPGTLREGENGREHRRGCGRKWRQDSNGGLRRKWRLVRSGCLGGSCGALGMRSPKGISPLDGRGAVWGLCGAVGRRRHPWDLRRRWVWWGPWGVRGCTWGGSRRAGDGGVGRASAFSPSLPPQEQARSRARMLPSSRLRPRAPRGAVGRPARPPRTGRALLGERSLRVAPVGAWVESGPREQSRAFVSAAPLGCSGGAPPHCCPPRAGDTSPISGCRQPGARIILCDGVPRGRGAHVACPPFHLHSGLVRCVFYEKQINFRTNQMKTLTDYIESCC